MICGHCQQEFTIYPEDKEFYQKLNVPEPCECPNCRMMTRLTFRNARSLYRRKCDFSGKEIISQYHSDQPFPVYDSEIWWSDKWTAEKYGQEYDFSKSFFTQIKELNNKVPHMSVYIIGGTLDNSDFTNCTGYLKDCYLIAEADYNEQCYYGNRIYYSNNCIDCLVIYKCELCYECIDCYSCYNLKFSQDAKNCVDSYYLLDCHNCQNCIGCVNLRYGKYMIFNQQYSKEEYLQKKQAMNLDTLAGIKKLRQECMKFFAQKPRRCLQVEHNENCVGNYLYNSKNAFMCFDSDDLENCRYSQKLFNNIKSCMDYTAWGSNCELIYECSACGNSIYNLKFCSHCLTNSSNLEYCIMCNACQDCFGCVGLNKKKFCIFNKQFSEGDYRELKEKIIAQMQKNGEYGRFFPRSMSDYGYNETVAMDYFPMTEKEARKLGFAWYEKKENEIDPELPICALCGKNYRIIPQEKKLYTKQGIPEPDKCPDCRHILRQQKRAQPVMVEKECSNCHKKTYTAYPQEKILCEECFNKMVY